MIKKRTFIVSILALIMTFSSIFSNVVNAETVLNRLTIADMPPELKPSIEWVYNNRMIKVGTPTYKNLIFDQIFAGNGTLNYVVRWQSSKTLSLEQRKKIAAMLKRQVNNWTKHLTGYDEWPYDTINVNVVGMCRGFVDS